MAPGGSAPVRRMLGNAGVLAEAGDDEELNDYVLSSQPSTDASSPQKQLSRPNVPRSRQCQPTTGGIEMMSPTSTSSSTQNVQRSKPTREAGRVLHVSSFNYEN